jgi:histidinol-phosphate aminotransferase
LPSAANFVFVRHCDYSAEVLAQSLREKNIIVRYFNKPRINEFLRITVGNEEQNQLLIKSLTAIFES